MIGYHEDFEDLADEGPEVSLGASKPATSGRFKTGQPWIVNACAKQAFPDKRKEPSVTSNSLCPLVLSRAGRKNLRLSFVFPEQRRGPGESLALFLGDHFLLGPGGRFGWF